MRRDIHEIVRVMGKYYSVDIEILGYFYTMGINCHIVNGEL